MGLTPHPHPECRGPTKSRAVPLLTLTAFVAYEKGEILPKHFITNVSYAIYPAKNRYLPDFMYSHDWQIYWDPNIHTAPMT